jgi:hypothetical protein
MTAGNAKDLRTGLMLHDPPARSQAPEQLFHICFQPASAMVARLRPRPGVPTKSPSMTRSCRTPRGRPSGLRGPSRQGSLLHAPDRNGILHPFAARRRGRPPASQAAAGQLAICPRRTIPRSRVARGLKGALTSGRRSDYPTVGARCRDTWAVVVIVDGARGPSRAQTAGAQHQRGHDRKRVLVLAPGNGSGVAALA